MKSVDQSSKPGCRICGRSGSQGMFLNVLEEENKLHLSQIHKFLQIDVSSTDDLPKSICHTCTATLNDFALLFDQCQTVQQNLSPSISCNSDLQRQNGSTDAESPVIHETPNASVNGEEQIVQQNPTDSVEQSVQSEVVESTNVETVKPSDPVTSVSNIVTEQEEVNETASPSNEDSLIEKENDSEKVCKKSNQSDTLDSNSDWKIHKVPASNVKLCFCHKCLKIYTCEEALKSHLCTGNEDELEISEVPLKKPKLESE